MWIVSKAFHFDAAHSLPHLPPTHKCHYLHGHTYKVVIYCAGDLVPDKSWVIDYADITSVVQPLIHFLDHKDLNTVLSLPTTAENIAFWFWLKIAKLIPVSRIDVHETHDTCCSYAP